MKYLKPTVFFVAFIFGGLSCIQEQESPVEILKKVEDTYSSLSEYEFRAEMETIIETADNRQVVKTPVYYAADLPGKQRLELRVEKFSIMVVTNGEKTWKAIPELNEYTERQTGFMQTAGGTNRTRGEANLESMAEQLTTQYETISSRLLESKIVGREVITIEGKNHHTIILENTYENMVDLPNTNMEPTRYWIDRERFLVLKQEMNLTIDAPKYGGKASMKQVTRIQKAIIGSKPDSLLFSFKPPEGAKKVEQLEMLAENQSIQKPLTGNKAIPFELISVEGEEYSLKELEGKVVVLDFWATWCGPCLEMHPVLDKLYREYRDDGLVVLGINSENPDKIRQYVAKNGYAFKNLMDPGHEVTAKYQVGPIPSIFFINRRGKVSSHLVGYRPEAELRDALKKADL